MKIDKLFIAIVLIILAIISIYLNNRLRNGDALLPDYTENLNNVDLSPLINPTLSPPLAGVEFRGEMEYPLEWPSALRFPEELKLIEANSGNYEQFSSKGYSVKLQFMGTPKKASDFLSSFYIENGWKIEEELPSDSDGILLLITHEGNSGQGIFIIEIAEEDPLYSNILGTVFP